MSPCLRIPWEGKRDQAEQVIAAMEAGGLIAFPTDTVWGVGTLASCAEGCHALYALKNKPRSQALPCLIPSVQAAEGLFDHAPDALVALLREHWPGALTVVGPIRPGFLPAVRAGRDTIGLRMPACPPLLELLAALPAPLASSSANPSGEAPLMTANAIEDALGDKLAIILEWEQTFTGTASTVIAFDGGRLTILRRGDLADSLPEGIPDAN